MANFHTEAFYTGHESKNIIWSDKRIWIILDISICSVGKTKPLLLDLLSSTGEFIRFLLKENNFLPPSYGKDILIPHQEVLQWIQIPEIIMFTLFISL